MKTRDPKQATSQEEAHLRQVILDMAAHLEEGLYPSIRYNVGDTEFALCKKAIVSMRKSISGALEIFESEIRRDQ